MNSMNNIFSANFEEILVFLFLIFASFSEESDRYFEFLLMLIENDNSTNHQYLNQNTRQVKEVV